MVYGVDINGNFLEDFNPTLTTSGGIIGSVVFADLNNDGALDLVAVDDGGFIHALDESGNYIQHYPISYQFPFSSSPMITDYDLDGDLEIICGTTGDLVVVDNKDFSSNNINTWSVYKGDFKRSGFYQSTGPNWDCLIPQSGDLNCDNIINILDIVTLVNVVVNGEENFSDYELWAADMNIDGIINILDIVLLVNIVVSL